MTPPTGSNDRVAARGSDTVTVLRTLGTIEEPDGTRRPRLATKRVALGPDGAPVLHGYDDAKRFAVEEVEVDGIVSLARVLLRLQADPSAFVVRAAPLPGIDRRRARRLLHEKLEPLTGEVHRPTFEPRPKLWLAVDSDGLPLPTAFDWRDGELSALHVARHLAAELQGCSSFWTFTSGAGFKRTLRMRLWFWLDRPLADAEAKRWLAGSPGVDLALYSPVQAHYTAAPLLGPGVTDPLGGWPRCGFLEDFRDAVAVPEIRVPTPVAPADPPMPSPDPARPYDRRRRYALAALARETEALAATPAGGGGRGRHHALVVAAVRMGRFVAAGELSVPEATAALVDGARRAGLADPFPELVRHAANGFTVAARGRAA